MFYNEITSLNHKISSLDFLKPDILLAIKWGTYLVEMTMVDTGMQINILNLFDNL